MGLRTRFLESTKIYELLQHGVSRHGTQDFIAKEVIRAKAGDRVLDIGCGPADIVSQLRDVTYVGLDHNPKYIKSARNRYGSRAQFHCWDVTNERVREFEKFDIVLLLGVLHHLTDDEIRLMLRHASQALKPEGRLITIDCAVEVGQHPIARFLARIDRGRYARSTNGYRQLISEHLRPQEVLVRHDLLQVPYTHAIITSVPH
jgi:SAM-dependent methyltransferase